MHLHVSVNTQFCFPFSITATVPLMTMSLLNGRSSPDFIRPAAIESESAISCSERADERLTNSPLVSTIITVESTSESSAFEPPLTAIVSQVEEEDTAFDEAEEPHRVSLTLTRRSSRNTNVSYLPTPTSHTCYSCELAIS